MNLKPPFTCVYLSYNALVGNVHEVKRLLGYWFYDMNSSIEADSQSFDVSIVERHSA